MWYWIGIASVACASSHRTSSPTTSAPEARISAAKWSMRLSFHSLRVWKIHSGGFEFHTLYERIVVTARPSHQVLIQEARLRFFRDQHSSTHAS